MKTILLVYFHFLFLIASAYAQINAIIFDCDGTLIDNSVGYYQEWQCALEQKGYHLEAEEFWKFMNENNLVGVPIADSMILKHYCNKLGYDCSDELYNYKKKFSAEIHTKGFPPIQDTVNFLLQLVREKKLHHLKIGLASGAERSYILRNLKNIGIDPTCFDVIVSGTEDLQDYCDPTGTNKPKPYIYLQAANKLGVHSKDCVAIEDSQTGVLSASSAGCFTIAIPNKFTEKHDFSKANLKMESFKNITPAQLLNKISNLQKSS